MIQGEMGWERGGEGAGDLNSNATPKSRGDEGGGGPLPGSGDNQASQKCAKGRPYKENSSQKTSRYGATQERGKRKDGGGGKETMTGGTNPLGTERDWARGQGRQGGGVI